MRIFEKGTAEHSYRINILGLRIRFRNRFAFKNNRIILVDKDGKESIIKKLNGLKVNFLGANAVVKIYTPVPKFENTTIICADNVNISIGSSSYKIANSCIQVSSANSCVNIGKNNFIRGVFIVLSDKAGLSVNIGDNCLIASNVRLQTTDFHTVIDASTKKLLNPPSDINIGNHCWLCEDVTITKGVTLPDETIVAAKGYVTRSFSKTNTIIGGIPAKIIKDQNTSWALEPYWQYLQKSN